MTFTDHIVLVTGEPPEVNLELGDDRPLIAVIFDHVKAHILGIRGPSHCELPHSTQEDVTACRCCAHEQPPLQSLDLKGEVPIEQPGRHQVLRIRSTLHVLL